MLYRAAPLVAALAACSMHVILSQVVSHLEWTHLALFMALTSIDLRPFLTDVQLTKIICTAPGEMPPDHFNPKDLSHFRNSPATEFWNSVALLKRIYLWPDRPLAPNRVCVAKLWNHWHRTSCSLKHVSFNPNKNVAAVIFSDDSGNDFLSCHWFQEKGTGKVQHLEGQYLGMETKPFQVSVSWSKSGSYLLCRVSDGYFANYELFQVDSQIEVLNYLRGFRLTCSNARATAALWISDDQFVFPSPERNYRRFARPWIYKLADGGKNLIVQQPEKRLRKEVFKAELSSYVGSLQTLESGECMYASYCCKTDQNTKLEVTHSVLHFRDKNLLPLKKELALPGILLGVANISESRLLLVYRENGSYEFEPNVPLPVNAPVTNQHYESTFRPQKRTKSLRKSDTSKRLATISIPAPYYGHVNTGSYLSSASSSTSSDEEKFPSCSFAKKKCPIRCHSSFCCYKFARVKRKNHECQILLAIYNLENNEVENFSLRLYTIIGPFPEDSKKEERHALPFETVGNEHFISTTADLIILRLEALKNYGPLAYTFIYHKGLMTSYKIKSQIFRCETYMHPSKNVLVQAYASSKNYFPVTLTCCPDLTADYAATLELDQRLLSTDQVPHQRIVTFVVTDENHDPVENRELVYEPSSPRYSWNDNKD